MADANSFNCLVCGKREEIMKRCSSCQAAFYCSRECQRLDWAKHQQECLLNKVQDRDQARKSLVNDRTESGQKSEELTNTKNQETGIDLNYSVKPSEKVDEKEARTSDLCIGCDELSNIYPMNEQVDQLRELHLEQNDISQIFVYVKYAKAKQKVELTVPCTGFQAFGAFSRAVKVPVEKLKLIHKGKLQTEANVVENLKESAVFLAFGEMAENEDGLEAQDIELIMKQLSVDRNVAIKALRKTNCLLDAIFEIGNDI